MACPSMRRSGLRHAQRVALRDADLLAHEVEPADRLRDRMLHLQAGVHLQEPEVPAAEQELHGPGRGVADRRRGLDRRRAHRLAQVVVEGGRGRLLDDLLVAALDRALALEAVHDGALLVAQDLHLDVADLRQPALQEDRVVAEGARRLAPRRLDRLPQVVGRLHDAHALAPAAGRGLDEQRIADRLRRARRVGAGRDGVRGQRRHAGRVHRGLGGELVAHRGDGVGRRPHPDQPRLPDGARECRRSPRGSRNRDGSPPRRCAAPRRGSCRCRGSSRPRCARPARRPRRPRARTARPRRRRRRRRWCAGPSRGRCA